MSISEKLTTIAENEPKVFDSGLALFEDMILHCRKDSIPAMMFAKTDFSDYTFKKTFKPVGTIARLFYNYKGEYFPQNMDFSEVTSVYESATGTRQCFTWAQFLKEFPDYGLQAINLGNSFDYCRQLVTIEKIRITKTITPPTFKEVISLVNIRFEGEIGQSISFSNSSKLSIESLRNIISCLYDFVGNGETTTQTLTLHATAKARLTEDDIKTITDKGWTLV